MPDDTGSEPCRVALVVLGPHRSGTSATTRVLALLGAALPQTLMPANRANSRGFWEPLPLVELHDRLLAGLGSRWDDCRAIGPESFEGDAVDAYRDEIARLLVDEYGEAELFVLKDPRICRLVPVYRPVFFGLGVEPRYVLLRRGPLDAVSSLIRRESVGVAFAGLLWLRHQLEAELATRDERRAFLSFESLRRDWRSEVERLTATLDVPWPRDVGAADDEIDAFLSHEPEGDAGEAAGLGDHPVLERWIERTDKALSELETATSSSRRDAARERLDDVRAELDRSTRALGAMVYEEIEHAEGRGREELRRTSERLAATERQLAARTAEWAGREAELGRRLGDLEARLAELSTRNDDLEGRLAARTAELDTMREGVRRILGSNSWRLTAPLRALRRRFGGESE